MVRGLIEDQHVGTADHHRGELTADFLTAGQNADLLYAVLAGEEHAAKESADVGDILVFGITGEPFRDVEVRVKELGVVLLEIGALRCDTPFVGSLIGLQIAHENLKECSFGEFLSAHEGNLVIVADDETEMVDDLYAVHGFGEVFDGENLIADLAIRPEVDVRVFAGRRPDIIELNLLQSTLAARCLL